VTVVDPAPRPGRGLAYRTTDPDHRLNAPSFVHSLLPDDAWHFSRWCLDQGLLNQDPQALQADGTAYLRRADFGRYLEDTLQAHSHWPATGSRITHVRDTAVGLVDSCRDGAQGAAPTVATASGLSLPANLLLLATGNPAPHLRPPFAPALAQHPAVLENPWLANALPGLAPQARVLVVGAGLTAMDVLSTLLQRGHRGPIVVVSRHGLRPRPQGPVPAVLAQAQSLDALASLPPGVVLARLAGPVPPFLAAPAVPPQVRVWLRALRAEIARVQATGGLWYPAFDDLRDAVWRLWPTLPAAQKRRFFSKLRTWYDVHRYRAPPPNQALVDTSVAQGRIQFVAARLHAVQAAPQGPAIQVQLQQRGDAASRTEHFDQVINCSGLDDNADLAANPLLQALHSSGWLRRDASGSGFEVDADCRAFGADGQAQDHLRLIGPPTLGSCGDPIGAMFIGAQIHRMLPSALQAARA